MNTFETLYELHRDGSWTRWEKDFSGNMESRRAGYVPSEVRDCAKFNRCAGVVWNGYKARPAQESERPAKAGKYHREVIVERRTVIRHDDDATAVAVGTLAGLVIGAIAGAASKK